jgi:hypothetical protein
VDSLPEVCYVLAGRAGDARVIVAYLMYTTLDGNAGASQAQAQLSNLQYRASQVLQPDSSASVQGLSHVGQTVCSGSYCAIVLLELNGGEGRIRTCDTLSKCGRSQNGWHKPDSPTSPTMKFTAMQRYSIKLPVVKMIITTR